jgi:cytochrome c nitrite reductase small subunit
MKNTIAKIKKRYFLLFGSIAAIVIAFVLVGPPHVLARSESPAFCVGCHTMESEYEAWIHTGAHRRKDCVDCHLPNQNAAMHYLWKSIDGTKDVLLQYSGTYPAEIKLSSHGREVVQGNCIRCHSTTVELINPERTCWECHRRLMHRRSGAIETT